MKCKMFICQSSVQRVNYAIFHYITLTILQKEYTVVLEELINIFSKKSCICICSIIACWAGLKGSWRCRRVETDESRPFIYAQVDSQESPASLTWLQVGMLRSYLYLSLASEVLDLLLGNDWISWCSVSKMHLPPLKLFILSCHQCDWGNWEISWQIWYLSASACS